MDNSNKLHLILSVKDLMHALNFANSIVQNRNIIAALSHIKLIAKNNILQIIATDMDLSLTQEIPVQSLTEGQTIVPSSMLTDIIRKIADKEITLKQENEKEHLEIIGANCNFNLVTLPVDKFPRLEDMSGTCNLELACKEFARMIDYTSFAMSTEETRYNLNGIYLHNNNDAGRIQAAATDGHRLSVSSSNSSSMSEKFGVILPRKTVHEILKIIKDSRHIEEKIQIEVGLNKVKFVCNNITMISKLIDGIFPEYTNFIPLDNQNKLEVNSKIFADVIDRVSIVTADKFKAVKVILGEDELEVTASGEDRGTAREFLKYEPKQDMKLIYSGSSLAIGFNPRYLTDVLSATKQENIEIYFKDASSPTLIKVPSNPADSFVIMPVKI